MFAVLFGGIFLLLIYLTATLLFVQIKKDNSIANFTWGGGCMLLSLYTFFSVSSYFPRQILVTLLINVWALRLILYIFARYKKGADPRFIEWEKQWGKYALLISFFWIFCANGLMLLIMSWPGIFVNIFSGNRLTYLDLIGLTIWWIGFCIEAISDLALQQFLKDPKNKGKIMDKGLWHYSRHPNYFGEVLIWIGLFLIACSIPYGWTTIIAPLTITCVFLFYSIPLLENAMKSNPLYKLYQQRTSMLIPWWKRKY